MRFLRSFEEKEEKEDKEEKDAQKDKVNEDCMVKCAGGDSVSGIRLPIVRITGWIVILIIKCEIRSDR